MSFKEWFSLLAKYKMGAGAFAIAGIAIGDAVVASSRVAPISVSDEMALFGLRLMEASGAVFVLASIVFLGVRTFIEVRSVTSRSR